MKKKTKILKTVMFCGRRRKVKTTASGYIFILASLSRNVTIELDYNRGSELYKPGWRAEVLWADESEIRLVSTNRYLDVNHALKIAERQLLKLFKGLALQLDYEVDP